MAEKWEDRTVEEIKSASSPATSDADAHEQPEQNNFAEVFNADGTACNLFDGSSPIRGASSTESDDRKPAALIGIKHPFDDLDPFCGIEPLQPERKRARPDTGDVIRMPRLEQPARLESVARMPPSHDLAGPLPMSFGLPYQNSTPVAHRPNVHAAHDPFSNASPGYSTYLTDPTPHPSMQRVAHSHESPHRTPAAYARHHYPQQRPLTYPPPYYSHPGHPGHPAHLRHEVRHAGSSPEDSRTRRTGTASGENPSEFRRGPTLEELDNAKTARARSALNTWYQRLQDLHKYKVEHGDCNVPQKYEPLPELGIWVNKQRMEKKAYDERKKNSMSVQKIKALNDLGFVWAKRKGQAAWNEKFDELVAYKDEHGDCQVPTKFPENPALGRWVSTQRSNYKEYERGDTTKMTEEKKNRLEAIGFKWTMMNI